MSGDQLSRVDPALRGPLEETLELYPGGVYAIPDLAERRRVDAELVAELTGELLASQTCTTEDVVVPGLPGDPPVTVRVYHPAVPRAGAPGIFFIHGGGLILGGLDGEHGTAVKLCEDLGAVVVSTGYRKAPEHPHPAPVSDCYATYRWMHDNAEHLGFDVDRWAIFGGSAGGNLALATALKSRDDDGPRAAYVMAPYPMLDHRNVTPSSHEVTAVGSWDRDTNIEAWDWFLGGAEPDAYATPVHAPDLSGLPPVFIDVGTVDVFRDEDVTMAQRLLEACVPCELHVYPGAYHGSELFAPDAELSQLMWDVRMRALRRALDVS